MDTIEPMLRQELEGSGIDLVYIRAEPGTSSQRNKGIKVARGDFYFFFDDDVLLEDDYIEKSMACFDNAQELPLPLGGVMGTFKEFPKVNRLKTMYKHLFQITHETDERPPVILPSGAARWAIDPSEIIQIPVCGGGRVVFRKNVLKMNCGILFCLGTASKMWNCPTESQRNGPSYKHHMHGYTTSILLSAEPLLMIEQPDFFMLDFIFSESICQEMHGT